MRRRRRNQLRIAGALAIAAVFGVLGYRALNPVSSPPAWQPPPPAKHSHHHKAQDPFAGAAALSGASTKIKWPSTRPLAVLFVGDSLTQGRLASSSAHDYVSLVTAGLERHGSVSATVDSHSGASVEYWMDRTFPAVDLAIIELGTNLLSHPLAEFSADYLRLIERIAAPAPNVKTVCLSVWHPDRPEAFFAAFNDEVRKDCGGSYVYINDLAHDPANVAPADHFHPNDAGHAAIARAVLRAITVAG